MEQIPEGYMKNSHGGLDPIATVKDVDKLRDQMVKEIVAKSLDASKQLMEMKQEFFKSIQAFVELSAEKYGLKFGSKKGNMTFMSYDGEYKVLVAVNENIVFDERLQIAKELIDKCIQDWSSGSCDEIKALVQDALYVGKSGNINKNRILGLRRLEINDERWKQAMTAISDSIQVSDSKQYVRIYRRNPKDSDKYDLVNLDISSL